jgi:hypothetical protein
MSSMVFRGIDGANPLGFLAAVGGFRLCALLWPEQRIRLRWVRDGGWRPELSGAATEDESEFCRTLHEHAPWAPLEAFAALGNNLTVPQPLFESVVRIVAAGATKTNRHALDFAAAFGSEVLKDEDRGRIQYTDLCFITGSGHQDFLGTALALSESAVPEHLEEALFGPWQYRKGLSMRWDPGDAREYALRWQNPGPEGVTAVWGANRLAFEALPMFPTVPTGSRLRTTGFRTRNRAHEFTWPIWTQLAGLDTIRSLVGLRQLEEESPDREELQAIGIEEVFRVQRVRIGQGANFKVSFRPSRAV